MRRTAGLSALLVLAGIALTHQPVFAQSISRGDRLFLMYNQINNQRSVQQLNRQQTQLTKQFQQFSGQGLRGPGGPAFVDPVDAYLRQVEGGVAAPMSRTNIPPIYGGTNRRGTSFQQQYRYFNPQRSPLY